MNGTYEGPTVSAVSKTYPEGVYLFSPIHMPVYLYV